MYLLDTNVLSELIRRSPNKKVVEKFLEVRSSGLLTSAICIEEIAFGVNLAPEGNRIWERWLIDLQPHLATISFGEEIALVSGKIRSRASLEGRTIGYADSLIAATALAHDLTLVTRNVRHFDRVDRLNIQNWFE